MSTPSSEDFSGLDGYVLRFSEAFSEVQASIEIIIGLYRKRHAPSPDSALGKSTRGRLSDEERNKLFRALATEVKYQGDLTNFGLIFKRAKQLRDMVGHSRGTRAVMAPGKRLVVGVAHGQSSRTDEVPEPLLPSTFIRMTADCEWLAQHVLRVGYIAQPDAFYNVALQPHEPPEPGPLPVGGEPLRGNL